MGGRSGGAGGNNDAGGGEKDGSEGGEGIGVGLKPSLLGAMATAASTLVLLVHHRWAPC